MNVTISSTTLPNYRGGGSTASIRIFAHQTFVTSTGTTILQGRIAEEDWYKNVSCTVSGTNLSIPSFTIDSTTDSSDPNAIYSGIIYDSNGDKVDHAFIGFQVPATTPLSWAEWRVYNDAKKLPRRDEFFTKDQVLLLLGGDGEGISISGYEAENVADKKVLDANSPTIVEDLVYVVGTLLNSLQGSLIPGQATLTNVAVDSPSKITVTWIAPATGSSASTYVLQRATDAQFSDAVSVTASSPYQFTNLSNATAYYFRVAAVDINGNQGQWSSTETATTLPPLPGPDTIASLWAYYEADSFALADGASISTQWTDLSGNARQAAHSGDPATYRTGQLTTNGAVVRFGGGAAFTAPDMSGLTAGEMFIVLRKVGAGRAPYRMGTSGQAELYGHTDDRIYTDFGSTVQHWSSVVSGLESWNYFNVFSAPNDFGMNLNGVSIFTTSTNTVGFYATPRIGFWNDGNNWTGDIAAVYIFSEKLSTANRNLMNAYIEEEYGL